jgi:hypothetical protein
LKNSTWPHVLSGKKHPQKIQAAISIAEINGVEINPSSATKVKTLLVGHQCQVFPLQKCPLIDKRSSSLDATGFGITFIGAIRYNSMS